MFNYIQKIQNNLSAPKKLREATALVADALKQAGHPEYVQNVYDNIEYNEAGLALEELCENLYEFSCPIPKRAYELIEEAGISMGIDSKYWENFKNQIV